MVQVTFSQVSDKVSFPAEEEKTLLFWKEIDAFKTSLKMSEGKKPFVFYDGPPFATGLPHYGHILAGTIKDVVTRYAHQTGYYVDRRFGWDCHGLPIEYEIDKMKKIKSRKDVEAWGLANYNEACRSIVLRYASEWRDIVCRFGRWIDFENDYKTMDLSYMESSWWVFSQLFQKGLVYRAFRVMPFSTALATPLSNFEVNQCAADISDPSIVVEFLLSTGVKALVWTTTPWTLPSNIALAVHPELVYVVIKGVDGDGNRYLVGKERLDWIKHKLKWKHVEIEKEFPGSELVGIEYTPLFQHFVEFARPGKAFRIIPAGYVTSADGTCIVHQAPAFGEEDFNTCLSLGLIDKDGSAMPCPIDGNGCFTSEVPEWEGVYVKDADKGICKVLKDRGVLKLHESEVHSVKVCPRSSTPLIYKAVASWFIRVDGFNDRLVRNNDSTRWVPGHVRDKRFKNWLADARDWLVSRNRYWGTPLPIWVNEDYSEIKCIGSVEELESLSGVGEKITDIHRHFIDDIRIPSETKPGTFLTRVDEVFDCWFESGSMPYGQVHYPFENKELFEKTFPANFIAEGLDQTRGWFYTLHVLATHLFDKPAFENVIVNGLVLAADGKKMSKSLRNYPNPIDVCNKHGADAVRLYLCNSPVVRAEPLKFKEEGVRDIVKDVFIPYFNAYRFFVEKVSALETCTQNSFRPSKERIRASQNTTDQWIYTASQTLISSVRVELENFRLYSVASKLIKFLDDLTNWYIKTNRDRMRGLFGNDSALESLCTLYEVLLDLTILLAPLIPFITELVYQNLKKALPETESRNALSVHFVMIPEAEPADSLNLEIERKMKNMQRIVEIGRNLRDKRKVSFRMPVKSITVMTKDTTFLTDIISLENYISDELNVMTLKTSSVVSGVEVVVTPNFRSLGGRVGNKMKDLPMALKNLSDSEITKIENGENITVLGIELASEDVQVTRRLKEDSDEKLSSVSLKKTKDIDNHEHHLESFCDSTGLVVVMDFSPDPELQDMALAREIKSKSQKLRKSAGLLPTDSVVSWIEVFEGKSDKIKKVFLHRRNEINKSLCRPIHLVEDPQLLNGLVVVAEEKFVLEGEEARLVITMELLKPIETGLKQLAHGNEEVLESLKLYLNSFLPRDCNNHTRTLPVIELSGKAYELLEGKHYERFE